MKNIPHFDEQQLKYFHDTSFLLSKRTIVHQLQGLLALCEQSLVEWVREESPAAVPDGCGVAAGKISRGENYRGLPYLVLDYPRLFKQKDIFTFRTMCWWGNFFSCTLHLQGTVLNTLRPVLKQTLTSGNFSPGTFICVNKTPWEYHFQPDNYQLLASMQASEITALTEKDFLKISRKISLEEYKTLPNFATNCLKEFMHLLEER